MAVELIGHAGDVTVTHFPPCKLEGEEIGGMVNIEVPIDCEAFITMNVERSIVVYGLWPDEARRLANLLLEAVEKTR